MNMIYQRVLLISLYRQFHKHKNVNKKNDLRIFKYVAVAIRLDYTYYEIKLILKPVKNQHNLRNDSLII